jgi:sialic acid synthase
VLLRSEVDNNPFVIAEVGQNHQGDLDLALQYIDIFAFEGASAVKFQTRNNKYLFAPEAYEKPYQSENAFAATYGAHREKLELKPEWLPIIKQKCVEVGVKFMSTPFDEPSLELLEEVGVDLYKIASFDLGNLPLLHKIGATGRPVVMSVGGGRIDQIRSSVETLVAHHNDIAVLHCVSEYPCEYNRLGLENIKLLDAEFPHITIGYSDHFSGILSGPVAFMLGARVFEKHVTLNHAWKGTDHAFSLEREGFRRFVRDVNRTGAMLPPKPAHELGSESVFQKLGKSVVAGRDIKKGEVLGIEDLSGKIFNEQIIPVRESASVIGATAVRDIAKGEAIRRDDIA